MHRRSSSTTPVAGRLLPPILVLLLAMSLLGTQAAAADHDGLHVTDLTAPDLSARDLADLLVADGATGDDVEIVPDSVVFTGNDLGAGAFDGGNDIIGVEDGIILSSGWATDVVGPNTSSASSRALDVNGDQALTQLVGAPTFDASILEFEFTAPQGAEQVFFTYVFGSDEYNEWVGSQFNDVFAFWINDVNCAVIGEDDDPVSINTINHGHTTSGANPVDLAPVNPDLYVNNDPHHNHEAQIARDPDEPFLDTEMDGLTVPLGCEAPVEEGTNTMRMAIADTSDRAWASWVLIEAGSLTVVPPVEDSCVDLIADGGDDPTVVGDVCVTNDGDDLSVTYTTTDGWALTQTHLHVGGEPADIPRNRPGNPMIGHFDQQATHDPAASSHTYTSSLADLDVETGDELAVAAHAVVQLSEGDEVHTESAWGEGDRFVSRGNWAMHFSHTVR